MAVKKKILFVNNLLQGGGVEKLMSDLIWHLHERYEIDVFTEDYCPDAENLFPADVKYLTPDFHWDLEETFVNKQIFRVHKKIRSLLFWKAFRRKHYDVIIAMKDGWIIKAVSRMQNCDKKYGWIHTDYNNYYYTYTMFGGPANERECLQGFDKIICVAEDIRKSIVDVLGDPGNLEVLYNPIDVENILEKAKEPVADVEPVPTPGVPRFLSVGRLNQQKGFDVLLEACHMLEQDGLQFEVLIVGGEEAWSDEHWRLYRRQKKLGLKNVKFLGGRKNPYKYMRCADWFISSSLFEGFSLVSQEAAVLDLPLMLTDCSGVRELIGDSEYGIVMEISVLDVYRKMKMVIEHPELQAHYKQKIMERKQVINFDERFQKIVDLF